MIKPIVLHAIVVRDLSMGGYGRALIRGSKSWCDDYLTKHYDHALLKPYTSQPKRWSVKVESLENQPYFK